MKLGLFGHRDFRLLWVGETTSAVGTAVTSVAMPLVAVTVLHASAFEVGVLAAAVWLPWLIIGLPAGAWIDRLARRPILLACDIAALVLLASAPIAAWFGVLTIGQLIAVALGVGVCSVFFKTSHHVFLPAVVESEHLTEANAKVQGSEAVALVAGPGLGGVLAQGFGAVIGLLADAASYGISFACLLRVKARDSGSTAKATRTRLVTEIREGLRYTLGDPHLRPITIYGGAANLGFSAVDALLVLFLVRVVGVSSGVAGALLAVGSVGGIAGSLVVGRLGRRLGTARAMLLANSCGVPFTLLIPLTGGGARLIIFLAGFAIVNAAVTVSNVIIGSFRQRYVPRSMLGRVTATTRALALGMLPVGAVVAGAMGDILGVRRALWVACGAEVAAVAVLYVGRIRMLRDLPVAITGDSAARPGQSGVAAGDPVQQTRAQGDRCGHRKACAEHPTQPHP